MSSVQQICLTELVNAFEQLAHINFQGVIARQQNPARSGFLPAQELPCVVGYMLARG
jgi:hypothetical protein